MKKILIIILFVFITFFIMCGFSVNLQKFTVDIKCESDGLLKSYAIKFVPALRLALYYGNNHVKMCENEFSGNAKDYLRYLNDDIIPDIEELCARWNTPCAEPTATYEKDGVFTYTEGANGKKANEDKLFFDVVFSYGNQINALFTTIYPTLSTSVLKKRTEKISTFSTNYSKSTNNRKKNIALACKKLDNLTIEANEEISFNLLVGKRTKENGYLEAKVILNGEYVEGVGGGVCQVSTTFYNAWCLSNLSVIYSKNHSVPSTYVKSGLDAMVSENNDLILKNSSPYAVYTDTYCDGETLTIDIYGYLPYKIELSSQLITEEINETYDYVYGDENKVISFSRNGYVYQSYRTVYENGKKILREKLRLSVYPKKNGLIMKIKEKEE